MEYKIYNQMTFFISTPQFDFRLNWREASGGRDTKNDYPHEFVEVYIIKGGGCTLEIEQNKYFLKKGAFAVIPVGAKHNITNLTNDFDRIVLNIEKDNRNNFKIFKYISSAVENKYVYSVSKNMQRCLDYIFDYSKNKYDSYITAIEFMITGMIYEFFNIIGVSFSSYSKNRYSEDHIKINMAIEFMRKNFAGSITSQVVANHVNLSVRQLNRLMLKHRGHTVKHLIDGHKINEAKLMLQNTKYSLAEIALKLGFSSEHSFIAFFKRICGVTPNEFRTNHK